MVLGKLTEWVGGAIVAGVSYLIVDKVIKKYTGKHIHQHAMKLWNRLRDRIQTWAHQHKQLEVLRILAHVDNQVQNVAKLIKRRLVLKAESAEKKSYVITTEEVLITDLKELGIKTKGMTDVTKMFLKV